MCKTNFLAIFLERKILFVVPLLYNKDLTQLPIYEPGLDKVISEVRGKNLFFSTNIDKHISESEMIFISVNTPTKLYGEGAGMASDLSYVESCARKIAEVSNSNKIVVEKSTLPVKTAETIKNIFNEIGSGFKFDILSNPEFLAEGTAINDLEFPDRVLIGGEQTQRGKLAIDLLVEIYKSWVPKEKIITTNLWSSELSKLIANAFLAQRISSINSVSELCESTGADIDEVAKSIGMDTRIGSKFLKASVGFGGSCFQKDILNLVYISKSLGLEKVANYWYQVIEINNHQKYRFAKNILKSLYNNIAGKKITFFGWAFKKDTNDSRESAAIYVADILIEEKAKILVFDPGVEKYQIQQDVKSLNSLDTNKLESVEILNEPYEACKNSHAIAILTEWDEFKEYDWKKIYNLMSKPAHIFDGRNILDKKDLEKIGFNYKGIGKN